MIKTSFALAVAFSPAVTVTAFRPKKSVPLQFGSQIFSVTKVRDPIVFSPTNPRNITDITVPVR